MSVFTVQYHVIGCASGIVSEGLKYIYMYNVVHKKAMHQPTIMYLLECPHFSGDLTGRVPLQYIFVNNAMGHTNRIHM